MDPNEPGLPPGFTSWPSSEDLHSYATGTVGPVDRHCLALLHFKDTIAPESSLLEEWPPADDDRRWYCTAVLRELLPEDEADYRSLATKLANTPRLARETGFEPGEIPHYSTLSRHVQALPIDDDTIQAAAARADRASRYTIKYDHPLRSLGPDPPEPDPKHLEWTAETPVAMSQKMRQATLRAADYLALTMPPLGFNRDRFAPNYEYPTESFYQLLAHIALEDCYAANGAEVLEWLSDVNVKVPPPSTLRHYAREYEVEDWEDKFIRGTCRLLEREQLPPAEPVHLAYDVTNVPWYGQDHEWTSGGQKSANTTNYWKHAVLSVASRDRNYIFAVTPIKNEGEVADAFKRQIRRVNKYADFELGHVYCDRGLYQEDIVTKCREHGLDFLIQARDTGAPGDLMARLDEGEADGENGVRFSGFTGRDRVNTFAYPIHTGEIGSDEREEDHTAWITDYDVEDVPDERLRKYAYQFRDRWQIETAIRQLKHDFQGRCGSSKREVRMFYSGAAQMFFNYWVALNHELTYHFGGRENWQLTATETLHAIREANVEDARRGGPLTII